MQALVENSDKLVSTLLVATMTRLIHGKSWRDALAHAKAFYDSMAAIREPGITWPAMCRGLVVICEHLPRPDAGFHSVAIDRPRHNDFCYCHSGKRYRDCCATKERHLHDIFGNGGVAVYLLLQVLPRKCWPELVGSPVPIGHIVSAADMLLGEKRHEDVAHLLEPFFADGTRFTTEHGDGLMTLLMALDSGNHPVKRARLLKRAALLGDRAIRSDAALVQAEELGEQKRFDAAWRAFNAARDIDAGSIVLSFVEVRLLAMQENEEKLKQRAMFWYYWLRRHFGMSKIQQAFMKHVAQEGLQAVRNCR